MWIPSSPEEFCWGNTVIGQLANGLKKDAVVDWKVLQWADCSSGEGSYFCHVKARPPPYIVDLSGTECLGWGQVRPEKAESLSNCSSGPGEQGTLLLELYKPDV